MYKLALAVPHLLALALAAHAVEVKHYPLDSLDEVITRSAVKIDRQWSSDGRGSVRVDAAQPATVRLVETGDLDLENVVLVYQARVRTQNVKGNVYLEMWCVFEGKGQFFSRSLYEPLTGTNEWVTLETPFFLKRGENPSNVKLNIVINGSGRVWVDDIRLIKGPLQ